VETHILSPITLANLDKGTHVGNLLHDIYENLDFTLEDKNAFKTLVDSKLEIFGLKPDAYSDMICHSIKEAINAKLLPSKIELKNVTNKDRLNELEFLFPIEHLNAKKLANVFTNNKTCLDRDYINKIENLSFKPLKGFMKGFIDMVFVHNDSFYIVDYKSNFLGSNREDYKPNKLAQSMKEHHYYLQYHIYTAALHRYLKMRIVNYNYLKHFGGVYYLFLRGLSNDDKNLGVFFDLPNEKLIEDLSTLFATKETKQKL